VPLSKYDALFGGDAAKAYRQILKRYGPAKGRQVFYALIAKRKRAK
jgi:hypothetical protein